MSINYPTSLDSFPNPSSTDKVNNATAALVHSTQHSNVNDAIEALEAKVGVNNSAVTTSHDYKLSSVTSTEKAVSKASSSFTGSKLMKSSGNHTIAETALTLTGGGYLDLASGGTGVTLSDPGANRLWGWDNTANEIAWITVGSGLSLSGNTLVATGTALNISATANETMTAGQTVGISSLGGGIARALRPKTTFSLASTGANAKYVPLGSNRVFILYRVNGGTTLKGAVGTVDRDTMSISVGAEVTYTTDLASNIYTTCILGTDKVAVMYVETANPKNILLHVSTIAGTTITANASQAFATTTNNLNSIIACGLTTDKAVIYTDESGTLNPLVRAFNVSTVTLGTIGTPVTSIQAYRIVNHTTDAFSMFGNVDAVAEDSIQIGTVSTVTITLGSSVTVSTFQASGASSGLCVVDSTHIVFAYGTSGNSAVRCASISGTTPTLGTQLLTGSATGGAIEYDANSTRLIYKTFSTAYTLSGTTLTLQCTIAGTGYDDGTWVNMGTYYATFKVTSGGNTSTIEGMCGTFLPGIVTQNVSRTGTATVLIKGSDTNQTSLIPGQKYTADGTGGVVADSSGDLTAITSTTISL